MLEYAPSIQHSQSNKLHLEDNCIPRLPPPASSRGHTRSRTAIDIPPLLPRRDSASPTRSSTYLPFFNASRSSSPRRPTVSNPLDSAEHAENDIESPQSRQRPGKVERIASWFEGSSDPVQIGLVASSKEKEEQEGIEATNFPASQVSLQSQLSRSSKSIMQSANSSTSKFSLFGRRNTVTAAPNPDDLETLNIRNTLFPNGPNEEFSPAAFKNLQQNAEGALRQFQQAYRELNLAMKRAVSEKNVQADELEASQTRNEHLKAQLVELADAGSEHERLIEELRAENEQLRANEIALRSIRVITDHTETESPDAMYEKSRSARRNRLSDISFTDSLDSASTDVSIAPSVFSHNDNDCAESIRSPGTSVGCPSPAAKHVSPVVRDARVITPHVQQNPSAHLRSLTTDIMYAGAECSNCHGVKKHEAWEVLGVMQAESAALKERIHELEQVQETATDLCSWKPVELLDIKSKYAGIIGGRAGLSRMDEELMREEAREHDRMKGCIV